MLVASQPVVVHCARVLLRFNGGADFSAEEPVYNPVPDPK